MSSLREMESYRRDRRTETRRKTLLTNEVRGSWRRKRKIRRRSLVQLLGHL